MSTNRFHIFLLISTLILISCGKDDQNENSNSRINRAPKDFTIIPEGITNTYIEVSFTQSIDPDYDKISYSFYLDDIMLADKVDYTGKFVCSNLIPEKIYSISVIASDKSGSTNKQTINVRTLKIGEQINHKKVFFNGKSREYGIYYPKESLTQELPLVIFLHGAAGVIWPKMIDYHFTKMAERENFIFVQPQGLMTNNAGNNMTHWDAHNTQPWNDVAFINSIIDTLIYQGVVDTSRIYVSGMSNGGFMTYTVAEKLQDRIAAIAPIAGLMDNTVFAGYNLHKPMPLCYIHGTADKTVPIEGDVYSVGWTKILTYWIANNAVSPDPVVQELPDINKSDNSTVTKYAYSSYSCDGDIVFYKINNGVHSIPGIEYPANMDINAFEEIWKFFRNHSLEANYKR